MALRLVYIILQGGNIKIYSYEYFCIEMCNILLKIFIY